MSNSPAISIENVTKRYGNFTAVNGLSLSVAPGEIFGFLGMNGAGKTTTLRMLAGILRPTSGRILIGGIDLAEYPVKAKSITGYIPDRPHLYSKLSAREFLYFICDLYRVAPADADLRIDQLLTDYDLLDWQHELVESYSHGMKQRLATCAALVHKPRVLVVDEPMVGLDPHGARLFKDYMRRYTKEGMAIMLSTHSLNVAEELSDRVAIIHQGSLLASGTLDDIKRHTGGVQADLENMFLELTSQVQEH